MAPGGLDGDRSGLEAVAGGQAGREAANARRAGDRGRRIARREREDPMTRQLAIDAGPHRGQRLPAVPPARAGCRLSHRESRAAFGWDASRSAGRSPSRDSGPARTRRSRSLVVGLVQGRPAERDERIAFEAVAQVLGSSVPAQPSAPPRHWSVRGVIGRRRPLWISYPFDSPRWSSYPRRGPICRSLLRPEPPDAGNRGEPSAPAVALSDARRRAAPAPMRFGSRRR